MRKLPPYCGECWFTNQQQFEKQAAGLLIDNTRFVENHGHGAPDLTDRATDQYWIFWPREAASKNVANFGKYTSGKRYLASFLNLILLTKFCVLITCSAKNLTTGSWDQAFNLTTSYRRDSDVPRTFGDSKSILKFVRYNKGELIVSDEKHLDNIWSRKNEPGTKNTAWLVSNCENTGGAKARWDYGQEWGTSQCSS